MKIKSCVLAVISAMTISIPTIVSAHPGHGAGSISNFLHQIIYHVNENLLLLLVVLFIGLGLRLVNNK
jgi:hypothetical protein